MQEVTIECDFCGLTYSLRFSTELDDPLYCPFCGSGYVDDDMSFSEEDEDE